MTAGDLIQFIDSCTVLTLEYISEKNPVQMPLWPSAYISAGEIGVVLKTEYFDEIGDLCEVLIGNCVFLDVPQAKIERLPASTTH